MVGLNTEVFLNKRFKKQPSIVSREIAGELILVPIRSKTAEIDSLFTLNEVGARIWQLIDGQKTVREIVKVIVLEYEVESAEAEKDTEEILQQLEAISAITEI